MCPEGFCTNKFVATETALPMAICHFIILAVCQV